MRRGKIGGGGGRGEGVKWEVKGVGVKGHRVSLRLLWVTAGVASWTSQANYSWDLLGQLLIGRYHCRIQCRHSHFT